MTYTNYAAERREKAAKSDAKFTAAMIAHHPEMVPTEVLREVIEKIGKLPQKDRRPRDDPAN